MSNAMNEHVQRARQIADALDSPNPERTLHEQFYAEWQAWEAEDPTRTMAGFDREIGRGSNYTGKIVRFVTGAAPGRAPFARTERDDDGAARRVLRDRPEVIAEALAEAEPEVRARVADTLASTPKGIGAMESMHRTLSAREPVAPQQDPLPAPPAFATRFWAAVQAVDATLAELERFGVRGVDARPETRAAAERLALNAADISRAVVDHVIAHISTEETA